jgi:hypothetical protein
MGPDENRNPSTNTEAREQLKPIKNCQYYEHRILHFTSKTQLSEAEKTVLKATENTLQERDVRFP